MKKYLSKILVAFIVIGFFLAPVGISITSNQKILSLQIEINNTHAQIGGTAGGAQTLVDPPPLPVDTSEYKYACGIGVFSQTNLKGCVAEFIYILWVLAAKLAEIAGKFFDFFVFYSLQSTSYSNEFVEKGWGIVRDVANIFFIIGLIYAAIQIVLSTDKSSSSKKLIGTIVIVAVLINFSLFATKVVIDAGNVLARIFYNGITPIDKSGQPKLGEGGEKSISLTLIDKYNPQVLVDQKTYNQKGGEGVTTAIYAGFLAFLITLYTAYVFATVALLFVARVVSLWIAMIFSSFAFASYALPFDIEGFGHKKWQENLFQNAFLAPIFMFFLYLISLFLSLGLTTAKYADSLDDTMQHLMSVFIPFAILFILLMQAKEVAVKYSGEIGKSINSMAGKLAGFAGGAVIGGAAVLGSSAIGGGAAKILGKYGENWKARGYTTNEDGSLTAKKGMGAWANRMLLKQTDATTKATFDARKTKLGSLASSKLGLDLQSASAIGLGSKEGGYRGAADRDFQKLQKESELFKTSMTDKQVQAWSEAEGYKYDAKKNEAKKKEGASFSEAKFIKENGVRPEYIETAQKLNDKRAGAFKDSMGQRDLLGSLAYDIQSRTSKVGGGFVDASNYETSPEYKRWLKLKEKRKDEERKKQGALFDADAEKAFEDNYEEAYKNRSIGQMMTEGILGARTDSAKPTVESINKGRVDNVKMAVGVTGAILAGGATGSLLVGSAGVGQAVGGGAAAGKGWVQDSAEGKMAASIDKQLFGLGKVEQRITEVKDVLAGYQEKISKVHSAVPSIITTKNGPNGAPLPLTETVNGVPKIILENVKINSGQLTDAISQNSAEEVSLRSEIDTLNKAGVAQTDTRMTGAVGRLKDNMTRASMLKSIEGIEEKIASNQGRLYDLGGKKSDISSGTK